MSNQFPALFQPCSCATRPCATASSSARTPPTCRTWACRANAIAAITRSARVGGAAMIVVEPVPVHRTAVLTRGNFRHSTDEIIPHFRKITDAVHAHGAVICHQLYHVGQHGDFDNSYEPTWSPSGLPSFHDSDGSHAMTEAEIEEIIEGFVAGGAARQGVGLRRHRAVRRLQRHHRPVLDALQQPPQRQMGRHVREPHALFGRDHARASARWRARISSSGWPSICSPTIEVSPLDRADAGDRRLARRAAI